MLRALINSQVWLSRQFDRLLPMSFRIDGNQEFVDSLVPGYLHPGLLVYDVGGGKHPCIRTEIKDRLNLRVIGLDIDRNELMQAPAGDYEQTVAADITEYRGKGDADLVICRALLEHVRNVSSAFAALASIPKVGGKVLIFVPSRNALFARLNLILPQNLKKAILHSVFPNSRGQGGFPSFYDRCTPRDFEGLARQNGFEVHESRFYFRSSYFSCFFPIYVIWRLWIIGFRLIAQNQGAETFSLVLSRVSQSPAPPATRTGESPAAVDGASS